MTTALSTVADRVSRLRDAMVQTGVTHYLVPSADEHINEYLPAWRERRAWMSGFTGSAGDLLVATDAMGESWLFTDGRYHLQAERELEGSGIALQRVGAAGAKSLLAMIEDLAKDQGDALVVGVDPMTLPVATFDALRSAATRGGGVVRAVSPNLVDELWTDRAAPPTTPLLVCPIEWTGATVDEKITQLRDRLQTLDVDAIVAVKLDQIAWILNLRSLDDIPYNPVFEAFLYVDRESVHLFVRSPSTRIPADVATAISGLQLHEYEEFPSFLGNDAHGRVLFDPTGTTEGVRQRLDENPNVELVSKESPIEDEKALKNADETRCMEHANLMASVAKTKALLWLTDQIVDGNRVTERSFRDHLEALYAEIDGFRGLSFTTISSTGEHGAIIHYSAADESPLEEGHLFLIDSGIQMDGGTTDDTRTVIVRKATQEQRSRYTAVLKSHVRGAKQLFPTGTSGAAIDAIVRSALWSDQLTYDHGTGHGVGAFLNVHEGPFGIAETSRRSYSARPLKPGMVTSIEPGFYLPSFGGIRLENLYQVRETSNAMGRSWLRFEPLTWIPFDPNLTDVTLLDPPEKEWIDAYHAECQRRLAPHLTPDENAKLAHLLS